MPLTKVTGGEIDGDSSINVTGIVTATKFSGNVTGDVNSTGVSTFTTLKVGTGVTISGGIVTATTFSGALTGNATGLSGTPNITVGTIAATSLNASGVVTATTFSGALTGNATGLSGTPNITVGNIIASSATISGNVSVAGTLTYEDVTNVDSVGLVTARTGIRITDGGLVVTAGITTFTSNVSFSGNNIRIGDVSTGSSITSGTHNFFAGAGAGQSTTSGAHNNFLGFCAGFANTTGNSNNFFGFEAGLCNTTGCRNNFFGNRAGRLNTTGSCNNFLGQNAGRSNTTGNYNNFFGNSAGHYNSIGANNNFLGRCAGFCNTTGSCNNFFGLNAGQFNTTGCYNNFFGFHAGRGQSAATPNTGSNNNFFGRCAGCSNTTGNHNNFLGANAGRNNTTGLYNNFFGDRTGCANTTGSFNNFFGADAGICNTTGCFNNFLGLYAGRCNTTGSCNNFLGANAGFANTTGSQNNFLGFSAGLCNTTGCENNFFGRYAGRSNTTGCLNNFFGNAAGFCNTTGSHNNFLGQCAGFANTTGCFNNFFGFCAGFANTTGNYNNFFGRYAGCSNTTGSHNIAIGNGAQLASATGSCQLVISAGGVDFLRGNSSGNIGIGTTNPRFKLEVGAVGASGTSLHVNGDARVTGILSVGQGTITINGNNDKITTPKLDYAGISSTNADTAVDVFVYDTRKDSDGGAWRKRTQNTSWYNETLNTATRGSRRDFPAVAVIVGSATALTIYDGDDPDMPMWMVFNRGTDTTITMLWDGNNSNNLTSVSALNGIMMFSTSSAGSFGADFIGERWIYFYNAQNNAGYRYNGGGIVNRNSAVSSRIVIQQFNGYPPSGLHNDVAMTVLPNAPIDPSTGLPVPTIAVATNGGVSVIRDDGNVWDIAEVSATWISNLVEFFGGKLIHNDYLTGTNNEDYLIVSEIPTSDVNYLAGGVTYNHASTPIIVYSRTHDNTKLASLNNNTFALGVVDSTNHLTLISHETTQSQSMVAFATTSYNTGWMHGDIKGAFLSDTSTASVTGTELVTNGTFTSNTTGWTAGNSATLSVNTNRLQVTSSTGGNGYAYQSITTVVGQRYVLSLDFTLGTGGLGLIWIGNSIGGGDITQLGTLNATSNYSVYFTATATTTYIRIGANEPTTGLTYIFDNVSVRIAEADRSVNNKGLAVYGTITKSAVATGSNLVGYSGFSASNYLLHPSATPVGTGNFSLSFWIKPQTINVGSGNYFHLFSMGTSTTTGQASGTGFVFKMTTGSVAISNGYIPYFYSGVNAGTDFGTYNANNYFPLGVWTHCVAGRNGGVFYIYLNGKLVQTGSTNSTNFTNTYLSIGSPLDTYAEYGGDALVALLRYSLSFPSPEQILKIYNDEKFLYQPNSQCTLHGTSDAVTALAYDDTTRLLSVGTSSGRSDFQGLRRINNTTTAVTTAISASNGLIAEQ